MLSGLILPATLIVAGFASIVWLSGYIEESRPPLAEGYEDTDLNMSGSRLKGFALGMEGLIADWYFMRALQYIGDKLLKHKDPNINLDDLRELNPRLLYPLLKNATELDPHFIAAYSYGAMVLPAIEPELAIDLAKKGIENNPDSWRLYQHLAYIYWKLGRYEEASETYEEGSRVAGAAPFMKLMAATMKSQGGSRDTARSIYREMLQSYDDEQVRVTADRRLKELDSLDEREAIDRELAAFRERNGRCPSGLAEIVPQLASTSLPNGRGFRVDTANRLVDPTDAPYLLDRETCTAKLDATRTGLPLK